MAGGSERRCVELANGIVKYTDHQACIYAERAFPESLLPLVHTGVEIVPNAVQQPERFYAADKIIIVNTDCKEFSTKDYWAGKSARHNSVIDLRKVKHMTFLYNFLVSPSQHLWEIANEVKVGIITTNRKFFKEITKQDRYEKVRLLPRYILGSPIDPDSVVGGFRHEAKYFGCHSKRLGSKWNPEWPKLADKITERYDECEFRFMGMKSDVAKEMNAKSTCLKENDEPVKHFLNSLDVFVFFPQYKREEPWARVIAEAMMAGLPIIALDRGGTSDQVLHWNNGILCRTFDDYHKAIVYMIEHPEAVEQMSRNSLRIAGDFTTERVIGKLMEILG